MIIIDKPYVSNFLIETIRNYNFPIISTKVAKELIPDNSMNWISESEAKTILKECPSTRVYTNSENSINWIENNFQSSKLPAYINVFKNKVLFRELLKDNYPNYFFKGISVNDLIQLNADELEFPIVVKPAVGFFSLVVYVVNDAAEWELTKRKLQNDIEIFRNLYPKEVIDTDTFIIEEYIEGEEYAIDCYFNSEGEPIILNILHHVFSSDSDVSDRVYSTSAEIINRYKKNIGDFLNILQTKTQISNFPAHVEVRIDKSGNIFPIEVNPLRFGGWCTTGDLSWYAYGINSYDYFLNNKKPNWDEIFKTRLKKKYSNIVLDNNSGIIGKDIASFDYNKLQKDFSNILSLRKTDFSKFPLFGFLFIETNSSNDEEINRILKSNLLEYITKKVK